MASIFSVYNLSRQMDAFKRSMDDDDMEEISELLKIEPDDTIILLYCRGEFSKELTTLKQEESSQIISTKIRDQSIF
jgi:hypothetical protein